MPPTTVKKTKIVLGADVDPLEKDMGRGEQAVGDFGDRVSSVFKRMAAGVVASLACCRVADFFKDSIAVAIEAEETFSKFGTVFENVFQQAEISAQNLTNNYGLSEKAAKSLLSATGDLLVGLGAQENIALKLSETVQKVSVDLSSFQNLQGGAARASDIITKAMLGERDALTSLGIKILESDVQHELLRRGQEKLTGQAMLLAKANITLDSIVAQSGKAIGDYARTADSAANQMRLFSNVIEDFQVKVGNALIKNESFQKAFQAITELFKDPGFIDSIANIGANLMDIFASAIPLAVDLTRIISGVISVISELKDVVIPLGIAFGTYFAVNKLTPFFNTALAGFSNFRAGIKQTTIDLEKGTISQAGALSKVGTAIKNLPTAVKISVAVFGAEIAGKLLAGLFDQISKLQDEQMALIVDSAKAIEGQSHKIVKEFINFRNAGEEYKKAFEEARKEVERFIKPTDNVLIKNKMMKMWLEKMVPEWKKYQDQLKAVGAKSGDLTVALDQNAAEFEKIRKSIGSYTSSELKEYLTKQVKLGILTKSQAEDLKNLNKLVIKQKEAYDKLSSSLGILVGKQLKDVNQEARNLNDIFQKNKDIFSENSDQAKIFDEKLQKLIDQFGGLNEAPKLVQDLNREFRQLNEIPEFPEQDNFEEFAAIADEMNTDILPEATIKFQEAEDKVKKINDEFEKDSSKKFAEKIEKLTDKFVSVGNAILNVVDFFGILDEKGLEVGKNLLNTFENVGKTIKSFKDKDIVGGIAGVINSLSSIGNLIISIFEGASGEMEAAQRRLQGLSGVSEDWAEKIEKLAQELGGAESAERAFNASLADIIRSTDITVDNFDDFIRKTREIVSVFERGNASAQETAKNFGAAFTEMLKAAEDLGQMGGEDITGLIMLADEFGLHVKEIAEFVESKNIAAFDSWKKSVEVFGDASIAVFDELRHSEEVMAKIPDDISAGIEGLTGALVNLSDAHRLNSDEVAVFEEKTLAAIAALEQQGVTGADSIIPLQDLLNRLAFLQAEYGIELDDTIQKLIDEGKTSGMITGDIMTDSQKQIALQERQVEVLEMIAEKFGVITRSVEDMGDAAENITGNMNSDFDNTSRNLSGIADTIYDDVIPAIGQMGKESDDVMWQNSILPDLEDWNQLLDIISRNIKNDLIVSLLEMGKNYDQIQEEINNNPILQNVNFDKLRDSFSDVFDDITREAQTGSRALSEVLSAGMSMGFDVDVKAFRTENLESALESFTKLKDIGEIDLREINREIWQTQKELKGLKEGSLAYDKVIEKISNLKDKLSDVTAAQSVFGDLSIGVLDKMFAFQEKVGKNQTLVNGIESATKLLGDFSKAQELTESEYQDFEDIVAKSFEELLGAGFKKEEAYKIIAPLLEQLDFLDKEFDLDMDDMTEELIEGGRKLGEVGEIQKTETELMIDNLGIMTTVLSKLVEALGVDLPAELMQTVNEMGAGIKKQPGDFDLGNSFLYDPVFPENEIRSDIYNNFMGNSNANGMEFDPGVWSGTKNITANINLKMYVTDNTIDTIRLAEGIKTVFKDNVQGAVDVVIEEIDQI